MEMSWGWIYYAEKERLNIYEIENIIVGSNRIESINFKDS